MKWSFPNMKQGYNEMLREDREVKLQADYGVLCMKQGDEQSFEEPKEVVYLLLKGKVVFSCGGKDYEAARGDCFHDNPELLHVPAGTAVRVRALADGTEVAIVKTSNSKSFEARFFRGEDCLTPSEERGAGTLNEASTRIVRTFFDRAFRPGTNFFIGEVVSYPGKWSSYPPHIHKEPEFYHYRFLPENGFGFAECGDEVYKVRDNDITGMPDGITHCQATAPGYAEYYLWVVRLDDVEEMKTDIAPEHAWAAEKTAKFFPEI